MVHVENGRSWRIVDPPTPVADFVVGRLSCFRASLVSELPGKLLRHDGTCKVGLAEIEERDVGKEADADDEERDVGKEADADDETM